MKKIANVILGVSLLFSSAVNAVSNTKEEVLVTVGPYSITVGDLEKTIASAPYGTSFVSMEENDQAYLRGNTLQRLVTSKLLYLEALDQKLDQGEEFRKELNKFEQGLLYRNYMDHLRSQLQVPSDVLQDMKKQLSGKPDALDAAKAMYLSGRFSDIKLLALQNLKDKYHAKVMQENLDLPNKTKDTLLMTADGFEIRYGDILNTHNDDLVENQEWVEKQLYSRAEMLLVVQASKDEGINVDQKIDSYRMESLPFILLQQKEKEWVPNNLVLQKYYVEHPEFSRTMTLWHVGQIVTASYAQANALRNRVKQGESFFQLASQYSIDPVGRDSKGDRGWVREGQGRAEFESVLNALPDNQVSEVIKSEDGFHLLIVLERRPGEERSFSSMPDKIKQTYLAEKLSGYLSELEKKYQVSWKIPTVANKDS